MNNSDTEFEIEQQGGINMIQQAALHMKLAWDDSYREQKLKEYKKSIKKVFDIIYSIRYINYHKYYCKSYVLHIHLTGIKPMIWRKIIIPSHISLAVFHDKILTPLFNWKRNFHAYNFFVPHRKDKFIGYGPVKSTSVDIHHFHPASGTHKVGSFMIESSMIYLSDVLYLKNSVLRYIYDLGDKWHHTIKLDDIVYRQNTDVFDIEILGGERSGPPENNGPNWRYVDTLNDIIKNNNVKQYDEWCFHLNVKRYFDAERFNTNRCKKKMKKYFTTMLARQNAPLMQMGMFSLGKSFSKEKHGGAKVLRDCFYLYCPNKRIKLNHPAYSYQKKKY
eukprot:243806_1